LPHHKFGRNARIASKKEKIRPDSLAAFVQSCRLRKCILISFYSPQMVATANTTKYTIENDLTKKKNNVTPHIGTATRNKRK